MQCPACEERLSQEDYNGLALGRCDSCKGSWLSGSGFAALTRMDGSGFSPRDVAKLKVLLEYRVKNVKPTEHPCPKCAVKLKARNYADIAGFFVEQCPKGCGVWVREGDLDRIRILRSLGRFEEVKTRARPAPAQGPVPARAPAPARTPAAPPAPPEEPAPAPASALPDDETPPAPKPGLLARLLGFLSRRS